MIAKSCLQCILLFSLSVALATVSSCVCDALDNQQRELSMSPASHINNRPSVKFLKTNTQDRGINYKRPSGSSEIYKPSKNNVLLGERSLLDSSCMSNQVHITLGDDSSSIIVSYASKVTSVPSTVELYSPSESDGMLFYGSASSYSELISVTSFLYSPAMGDPMSTKDAVVKAENTAPWAVDPITGEHWANYRLVTSPYTGMGQYNNPYMYYDSPVLHTVTVSGLVPGQKYKYRVGGSCELFQFVFPGIPISPSPSIYERSLGAPYPFRMGLTGDVGQTNVSVASMNALAALAPDIVLLAGDLSYADGWPALWDSFGNTFQRLASEFPVLTTGGNHEVGSGEAWLSYRERYPTPFRGSGSTFFCYWGKEVGPVHFIALCSYTGFDSDSLQYAWLKDYLATSIDRSRTPWLVVMMHTPLYSSNNGHWMEGELMRRSMEELLFNAGVDVILAGHVHSYERTHPTYLSEPNICGPSYLNLGDGGNYEGPYAGWRMQSDTPDGAPLWSAFREASFGVGNLDVLNDTHASYSWHRHACGSSIPGMAGMDFSATCVTPGDQSAQAMLTVDSGWISRPSATRCPNRWYSSPSSVSTIDVVIDILPYRPFDSSSNTNSARSSDSLSQDQTGHNSVTSFSPLVRVLIVVIVGLGLVNVALVAYIMLARASKSNKDVSSNKYALVTTELKDDLITREYINEARGTSLL